MKYLVDTHLAIWSVADSGKLSAKAAELMRDDSSIFFVSAASVWEIAIKRAKHPEDVPIGAEEARNLFLEAGYRPVRGVSVDQFPLTGHIETIVLLQKLNS